MPGPQLNGRPTPLCQYQVWEPRGRGGQGQGSPPPSGLCLPPGDAGRASTCSLLPAAVWAACHAQPLAVDVGVGLLPGLRGPRQCGFGNAHPSAWDAPPFLQALLPQKEGAAFRKGQPAGTSFSGAQVLSSSFWILPRPLPQHAAGSGSCSLLPRLLRGTACAAQAGLLGHCVSATTGRPDTALSRSVLSSPVALGLEPGPVVRASA